MALPKRRADHTRPDQEWHALYEIENPVEVDAYVVQFPSLIPILTQASRRLATAFKDDLRLTLRSEIDPEEEEEVHPYLVVDIVMSHPAEDAWQRLNDFDDNWWLDAMPRDGATIVFMPR